MVQKVRNGKAGICEVLTHTCIPGFALKKMSIYAEEGMGMEKGWEWRKDGNGDGMGMGKGREEKGWEWRMEMGWEWGRDGNGEGEGRERMGMEKGWEWRRDGNGEGMGMGHNQPVGSLQEKKLVGERPSYSSHCTWALSSTSERRDS